MEIIFNPTKLSVVNIMKYWNISKVSKIRNNSAEMNVRTVGDPIRRAPLDILNSYIQSLLIKRLPELFMMEIRPKVTFKMKKSENVAFNP